MQVYDKGSQHERTKRPLNYHNQSAVNAILDDTSGLSDSSVEEHDLPAPGEICTFIPTDAQLSF